LRVLSVIYAIAFMGVMTMGRMATKMHSPVVALKRYINKYNSPIFYIKLYTPEGVYGSDRVPVTRAKLRRILTILQED
jgi:hypothetical protein